MERTNTFARLQTFALSLLATVLGVIVFAQEKAADFTVDVNTTTTTTKTQEWFTNPMYWVIGAVVLILLVALIVRGGNNSK